MTTTYKWHGGSGAFNNAAKWSPKGVPGLSDNADFPAGGVVNGGSGGVFEVATLSVEAKVTFTSVDGSYSPNVEATNGLEVYGGDLLLESGSALTASLSGIYEGQPPSSANIDSGGAVTVSTAQLHVDAGGLTVGGNSDGKLTITKSGTLTATSGSVDYAGLSLGSGEGSSGTLTVSDKGYVDVTDSGVNFGYSGDAKVVVSSGGTILLSGQSGDDAALGLGATSTSKGILTVTGAGSLLAIDDGTVNDGFQGTGAITVAAGATFEVTIAANGVQLGVDAGGAGSLTLNDGVMDDVGELQVGQAGKGTFVEKAGSTATAGTDVDPTVAPALSVGQDSGGSGVATVTGAGTELTIVGGFSIGLSGKGVFSISGGAEVGSGDTSGQSGAGIGVGLQTGGVGSLTVTGAGSSLGNTGIFVIGSEGTGHVTVSGGAKLATSVASTLAVDGADIGAGKGAAGTLTLTTSAAFGDALNMVVGVAGTGVVSVATGASLSVGNSLALATSPVAMILGESSGASGKLTIGGTGSVLSLHGQMTDGDTGKGVFEISAGGSATTGDASGATDAGLLMGSTVGGVGSLVVTGAKAALTNTGLFEIADGGSGSMTISAGGSIATSIASGLGQDGADLGIVAGSKATALITGAGSVWSVGSNVVDGVQGAASITVSSGGSVAVQSSFVVGDESGGNGKVTIESGGVVSAQGEFTIAAGTSTVGNVLVEGSGSALDYGAQLVVGNQGTGVLTIDAGAMVQALSGGSGEIDMGIVAGSHGTLVVAGTLSGTTLNLAQVVAGTAGTAKVTIDGGTLTLGGDAMVGKGATVTLDGGTLQANQIDFLGGVLTGHGTLASGITKSDLAASGGTLTVTGAFGGTSGVAKIDAGATLAAQGGVAAHTKLTFEGSGATLDLADPAAMKGLIADFAAGNTIDLAGITSSGFTYTAANGHLTIDETSGHDLTIAFTGAYTMSDFLVNNVTGGVAITHS